VERIFLCKGGVSCGKKKHLEKDADFSGAFADYHKFDICHGCKNNC
jgi:hypothetical protein